MVAKTFRELTAKASPADTELVAVQDATSGEPGKTTLAQLRTALVTTTAVTTAGALMDSEVDADIKTLSLPANVTITSFAATVLDDADAAAARVTLGVGDGTGDLVGPAGGTVDNEIMLFDDTTGKLAKGSGVLIGDVRFVFDTTPKTSDFTAEANNGYWVNPTGGAVVATLPEGADGDAVIIERAGTWGASNTVALARSGTDTIRGSASNLVISDDTASRILAIFNSGSWEVTLGFREQAAGDDGLLAANNLNDVADPDVARSNIGAVSSSDISDAITALSLGGLSQANYGDLDSSGAGAPSANARFVGEVYTNTSNDDRYIAITTGNGASDWELQENLTVSETQASLFINTFEVECHVAGADGTYELVGRNYSIDTIAGAVAYCVGGTTPNTDLVIQIADDGSANPTAVTGLGSGTPLDVTASETEFTATAANTVARTGTTDRKILAVLTNTTGTPDEVTIILRCTRPVA